MKAPPPPPPPPPPKKSRLPGIITIAGGGVLAVTFTNKAAKEMLTRLSAMLPVPVRGMWIGTFHGLCNRFLRAHWKLAGLPQSFQILDTADSLSAVPTISSVRIPPRIDESISRRTAESSINTTRSGRLARASMTISF